MTHVGHLHKDRVDLSPSDGLALTLFDPATLKVRTNVALVDQERVRADVAASTGSDNRTVYDESQTRSGVERQHRSSTRRRRGSRSTVTPRR